MGKQAKIRCWRKENGFLPKQTPDSDGVVRAPMSPELRDVVEELRRAFIAKFGREPGPDDPLIFDPSKDEPTPLAFTPAMSDEMLNAMLSAGVDPMLVYATWKTGRMVTKENSKFLEDEELEEWNEACEEWKAIEAGDIPPNPALPVGLRPGARA